MNETCCEFIYFFAVAVLALLEHSSGADLGVPWDKITILEIYTTAFLVTCT